MLTCFDHEKGRSLGIELSSDISTDMQDLAGQLRDEREHYLELLIRASTHYLESNRTTMAFTSESIRFIRSGVFTAAF